MFKRILSQGDETKLINEFHHFIDKKVKRGWFYGCYKKDDLFHVYLRQPQTRHHNGEGKTVLSALIELRIDFTKNKGNRNE